MSNAKILPLVLVVATTRIVLVKMSIWHLSECCCHSSSEMLVNEHKALESHILILCLKKTILSWLNVFAAVSLKKKAFKWIFLLLYNLFAPAAAAALTSSEREIDAALMLRFIHNIHLTMPGVISYLEGPKPLNGREWMLTGHLAFSDSSIFPAQSSFTFQPMAGRHFTLLCGYWISPPIYTHTHTHTNKQSLVPLENISSRLKLNKWLLQCQLLIYFIYFFFFFFLFLSFL